tara:strand:+ start:32 stop:283 length:252 start_codon:yes stop_codon:yes gene_type:complete
MTKKKKGDSSMSKTKGSSMQRKKIGGLGDYIVLKEEKEVIFYLENPFPTVMAIPSIMKERFPDDFKSIVTRDLDEFKRYREKE